MTTPAKIIVEVSKVDTTTLCLCTENGPFKNLADHMILTRAINAQGNTLPEWSGTGFRCGDGADLLVDEIKRVARKTGPNGVPVVVLAGPGTELDSDLVTVASEDQCYAAAEALYHLLGGKAAGYTPVCLTLTPPMQELLGTTARTHWYLVDGDGVILDPTADQFKTVWRPLYYLGTRKGFLTKAPSKKAQALIDTARRIV